MTSCCCRISLVVTLIVLSFATPSEDNVYAIAGENSPMGQQSHTLEAQITKNVRLNYPLFLPQGYGKKPETEWPLILFLHGTGERGNDLELVKIHGIPKIVEHRDDFPFITVSPQCARACRQKCLTG